MSDTKWLAPGGGDKRRSAQDAIQVLLDSPAGFAVCDQAEFIVGRLKLPSGQIVGHIALSFKTSAGSHYLVSLPISVEFSAILENHNKAESMPIEELNGGMVCQDGNVTLADGRRVRGVTFKPALLPRQLSELDWRILHATIDVWGIGARVYRSFWAGLNSDEMDHLPACEMIDFGALTQESFPKDKDKYKVLLKRIRGRLSDRWPLAPLPTETKIARTLQKVGVRIPGPRSRPRSLVALA